jgi:hypothetical protein
LEKSQIHIDQQLKGKFETFQPAVPFQFEKIAARLDAKKSRRRTFLLWSSVAAVVFTAVSGTIFLLPDTATVNQTTSKSETASNAPIASDKNPSSNVSPNSKFEGENTSSPSLGDLDGSNQKSINENTPALSSNTVGSRGINLETTKNVNKKKASPNSIKPLVSNLIDDKSNNSASSTETSAEAVALNQGINNAIYTDFSGKSIQTIPTSFGYFLQLPVRIHSPQMPKQPLSSWAFEVGYDQNQTAMAYQISPGREKYVHKNYINRMKEGEFALNAPQLQASLKYFVNKNWSLSVGLGFAQTRTMQRFNFRDSIPVSVSQGFESDALGNYPIFGYLGLGQQVAYEGIQTVQMLSIPMALGYQYPINRFWSFSSEISSRYNRLFASQGKTLNYHDLSLLEADNAIYRASIWSARVSAGAEYRLTRNQYLGLRVNTQGAFTPLYKKDASVVNRGWSLGMSVFYTMKLF